MITRHKPQSDIRADAGMQGFQQRVQLRDRFPMVGRVQQYGRYPGGHCFGESRLRIGAYDYLGAFEKAIVIRFIAYPFFAQFIDEALACIPAAIRKRLDDEM